MNAGIKLVCLRNSCCVSMVLPLNQKNNNKSESIKKNENVRHEFAAYYEAHM